MGSSIALPALHVNPPEQQNTLSTLQGLMQMRGMQQQQQSRALEIQQQQQQLADSKALTRAINDAGGDPDKTQKLALQYGVSAKGLAGYQDTVSQLRQRVAQTDKDTLDNADKQHENLRGAIQPLVDLAKKTQAQPNATPTAATQQQPGAASMLASMAGGGGQSSGETVDGIQPSAQPQQAADPLADKKQAIWAQQRQKVLQNPKVYGIDPNNPQHMNQIPEQYPGDDWIMGTSASLATGHTLVQEGNEKLSHMTPDKMAMEDYQNKGMSPSQAFQQVEADKAGQRNSNGLLAPPQIQFMNRQLAQRIHVLDPNAQIGPEWQLQPNATRRDYQDLDKALEQVEKAKQVKAEQDLARQSRGGVESEKSYQFNSNQLEKISTPIEQIGGRISRLKDTIAQGSPQSDALVAPELLSIMAGGQGSGLRMNEAEIARIVGGRSNWQGLQAAINQWRIDPSKANSITPSQRQQIRDLVSAVDNKVQAKQQILEDSRTSLYQSHNPDEHKQIVAQTRNRLAQIDQGSGGNNNASAASQGMIRVQIPGHPPGQIPAAQRQKFLQENPGAQVIE